jgi:predicted RecA/RadA family phage recombinase
MILIGDLPAVAAHDMANGERGTFLTGQVIRYAKAAVSFSEGDAVYFDSGANVVTNTDSGGSNQQVGTAMLDETGTVVFKMFDNLQGAGGGGGGGGTALPVLTTDPVSPADEEQWFLYTAPTNGTSLTDDGTLDSVAIEWLSPLNHSFADLEALFPGQPATQHPTYNGDIFDAGGLSVIDLSTIEYDAATSTIQNVVDAMNTFAFGAVGYNVVQVSTSYGGSPTDLFDSLAGGGLTYNANSNAIPDQMRLKIHKSGITYSQLFTG